MREKVIACNCYVMYINYYTRALFFVFAHYGTFGMQYTNSIAIGNVMLRGI